jgi:hypothetical protein
MGKRIRLPAPETLQSLVELTHLLAQNSAALYMDNPHVKKRMRERKVSHWQILDVLRKGKGVDGPTKDKYGGWRIKMKYFSAGRIVQVVVVIKQKFLEVVTVI